MVSGSSASTVWRNRRTTLLVVLVFDILIIAFTLAKGSPTIWHEFEREKNLWTFGNSIQAVFVAVVAYTNYLLISNRRSRAAWGWGFLACAFLFFGFDDMLILHERAGHAVENAIPVLSRASITLYMDDIIQLGYVAIGAVFGAIFLTRTSRTGGALRYYMYGVAAMFIATLIGLNPAMKPIPFPMAVIQLLQLTGLYMFLISFSSVTASEIALAAGSSRAGDRSTETEAMLGGLS